MRRPGDVPPRSSASTKISTSLPPRYLAAPAPVSPPHREEPWAKNSSQNREQQCAHHCPQICPHECTRRSCRTSEATRISGPHPQTTLTGTHPALERAVGSHIKHPAVLEILTHCVGPNGIRDAGNRKLTNLAVKHEARLDARPADEIIAARNTQTVTVPGSKAAEIAAPKHAESLKETLLQRKGISDGAESMLDEHPLSQPDPA